MNNNLRYIAALFFTLLPFSSYAQRLLLEDTGDNKQMVIIDGYGMNKDVLAVTAAEQGWRKNGNGSTRDYGTNDDNVKIVGLSSAVNRVISAKFEILPYDLAASTGDSRNKCHNVALRGEKGAWRVPTLNEALLMVLFYDQIVALGPRGFDIPVTANNKPYLTATANGWDGSFPVVYFYHWTLQQWTGRTQPITGYYSSDSYRWGDKYLLRCIRDIPQ